MFGNGAWIGTARIIINSAIAGEPLKIRSGRKRALRACFAAVRSAVVQGAAVVRPRAGSIRTSGPGPTVFV
jgi:hypothetical protein